MPDNTFYPKPWLPVGVAVMCLIFAWSSPARAEQITERVLKNGLKIIVSEDHKVPLAVFEICYRVGAIDDPGGRSGLSHLLEHMMFKGTPRYGSKAFSKLVMKYGGMDNAFTSQDFTCYYQVLPPERVGLSVDLESDRMANLILDGREFLSERDVVREERRLRYEDSPQASLDEAVDAAAFAVHPYHRPVIGWMSDLGNVTRDDLVAHYRKFYAPQNAMIVAVGDLDPETLISQIDATFGKIENQAAIAHDDFSEPAQSGERRVILKRKAELPYIIIGWHAPSLPDADAYALDVLSEVLGGGKSGRFYRSLIYEKKLALSADVDYRTLSRDPYLFMLDATAAAGVDIAALEAALYAEVEKIKAEPPTEFEVQKAKNSIEAAFVKHQDAIFNQAQMIARFDLSGGGWRQRMKYLEQIRAVKAEDVARVAGRYLTQDNRTVGVLIPTGEGSK